jgi:hypothetical protein
MDRAYSVVHGQSTGDDSEVLCTGTIQNTRRKVLSTGKIDA